MTQAKRERAEPLPRERELILLADDDDGVISLLETNLTLEGFRTTAAHDGAEALRVADQETPDLLILDVTMPKLDGLELCRRIRTSRQGKQVPIIFVTAHDLLSEKLEAFAIGADDYVTKPFDVEEVIARVNVLLERARWMRGLNPLTELPGNGQARKEVEQRITDGEEFALLYVDLDNFKAFNDHYSFVHGDEALRLLSSIMKGVVEHSEGGFVGHLGGDDFVAVVPASSAEEAGTEIVARWDAAAPLLYSPEDRERGYIQVINRRGRIATFPIMTVSIGIATTARRSITSYGEASYIATEMKRVSKSRTGSSCAIDRRLPSSTERVVEKGTEDA